MPEGQEARNYLLKITYKIIEIHSMTFDYALAKIYKIVDLSSDDIYVGSTCEPTLACRLACHVRDYKSWKKCKHNYITYIVQDFRK